MEMDSMLDSGDEMKRISDDTIETIWMAIALVIALTILYWRYA